MRFKQAVDMGTEHFDRYVVVFDNNEIYAMNNETDGPNGMFNYCGRLSSVCKLASNSTPIAFEALPEGVKIKIDSVKDKYHSFDKVEDVVKHYGLKNVCNYVQTQHGLPSHAKRDKEAFINYCGSSPYGGMFLDEKVIEWANQGEIARMKSQSISR